MIAQQAILETIARIQKAFPHAIVGMPAAETLVAAVGSLFGPLPAEVVAFLRVSNGLDLLIEDRVIGQLYGTEAIECAAANWEPTMSRRLVPVRGDGCGNFDCVDSGDGPTRGAILFWDHEEGGRATHLLGGDFTAYLSMWADHMTARYDEHGAEKPAYRRARLSVWPWVGSAQRVHPWPFDEAWMRARDPRAEQLLGNSFLRRRFLPRSEG